MARSTPRAADPADGTSRHAAGHDAPDPLARSRPRNFRPAWEENWPSPEFTDSDIHIVAGLCCRSGTGFRTNSTRVYRLQTDAGERLVGRRVSPDGSAIALEAEPVDLSADAAFTALMDGRTILDLADGLQLRRVRVMGEHRIELTGFTDAMRDRLRA